MTTAAVQASNAQSKNKYGQSVQELAAQLGVEITYTDEAEKKIYHDLLVTLYRRETLTFEQQVLFEDAQKAFKENQAILKDVQKDFETASKVVKSLERERARKAMALGRSASQIKEDLIAFGELKENSTPKQIKEAILKEQERMLDVAEEVAELDFDIRVATKKLTETEAKVKEVNEIIFESQEAIKYWTDLQKYNTTLNGKVMKKYKELTGIDFDKNMISKPNPLLLQGIPGQGKTGLVTSAGMKLAKDLDLNFIENLKENYQARRDDLVIVVQECAGETSGLLFGGLPKSQMIKVHTEERSVLTKAFNKRFMAFETAAGGILLFDDVSNGSSAIQNQLLPVVQHNSFAGLFIPNALVTLTANLGSIDQTMITQMSSALKTRLLPLFVADRWVNLKERLNETFSDSLGTLGVVNFFDQKQELFGLVPNVNKKAQAEGFSCSRTITDFIKELRNSILANGGRGVGEEKTALIVEKYAHAKLGSEVGEEMTTYLKSYFSGTHQLAMNFINAKEETDIVAAKTKFRDFIQSKGGAGTGSLEAYYEYTTALVDLTLSYYDKAMKNLSPEEKNNPAKANEILKNYVKKFAHGIKMFDDPTFAVAITQFRERFLLMNKNFSKKSANGTQIVEVDVCVKIAEYIAETGLTKEKGIILAENISAYNSLQGNVNLSNKAVTSKRESLLD